MSPQKQAFAKVAINFGAVVLAVWTAEASRNAYMNWRAARAAKAGAPAPVPAPAEPKK